jgi:hypothetical protein
MSEIYRGFLIERCEYVGPTHSMAWQWSPEEVDGTPYRYEADPYACRDAIDEHLDEQDALAELAHWNRTQAL